MYTISGAEKPYSFHVQYYTHLLHTNYNYIYEYIDIFVFIRKSN